MLDRSREAQEKAEALTRELAAAPKPAANELALLRDRCATLEEALALRVGELTVMRRELQARMSRDEYLEARIVALELELSRR